MLSTAAPTSSSTSGGRQRTRFQHSRTSITTAASTPCRSRCPAIEAIVLFRSPSRTPSRTSRRQWAIGCPSRPGSSTAWSTQSGNGAKAASSGVRSPHPRVALARCVERRRRDHVSAVAAQIHAAREAHLVPDKPARVSEVEVPAATSRATFHGRRQAIVLLLETVQARIAAVPEIDIEHDEAGNGPVTMPIPASDHSGNQTCTSSTVGRRC